MILPEVSVNADGDLIAAPSGSAVLAELLVEYEAELTRAAPEVIDLLAPGLDPDVIRSMLAEIGVVASDEVVTWFSWHDGRHFPADRWAPELHPFIYPTDLAGSIALYKALSPLNETVWSWKQGWLMISKGLVGLMISSDRAPDSPSLVQFCDEDNFPGMKGTHPRAVTLCPLVTTWIQAMRSGAIVWRDGAWSADQTKFDPILRSGLF